MANLVQAFNDSQLGIVVGTVFHTLGAIAFLGGLVAYIAWHRHLMRGHHHSRFLNGAAFLTYIAILVNLVGGFMRTWESGHPHVTQFFDSPWVRAISIKHIFLFAGMAAAVYLFEVVAPRLLRAFKAGKLAEADHTGHRIGVFLATLGIVMSAVLGAVSQVVPLLSGESGDEMTDDDDNHPMEPGAVFTRYHNATGSLADLDPTQAAQARSTFEVVEGTLSLNATLLWNPTQACVRLNFVSPGNDTIPATACSPSPGTGTRVVEVAAPATGTWQYQVDTTFPTPVAWQLSIRMPVQPGDETLLANSVTITPGTFYEINTEMPLNGTFNWDWTTTAQVHFNIHSHFNGQVQDHLDKDASSDKGNFTNDKAGGYSLMWENTGTLPVTLDYKVWGEYTLDSIFP